MIKRKATFFLGIFIILIQFLGVPSSWKTIFTFVSGLIVISTSVDFVLPKKPKKISRQRDNHRDNHKDKQQDKPKEKTSRGRASARDDITIVPNENTFEPEIE